MEESKKCGWCGETKPLDCFYKTRGYARGHCKECAVERMKQYQAEKRRADPDHYRLRKLQRDFGISLVVYTAIAQRQSGVCAICKESETEKAARSPDVIKNLAVDHDHTTGEIRGLLCRRCNTAIGQIGESLTWLKSAILYLTDCEQREWIASLISNHESQMEWDRLNAEELAAEDDPQFYW